MSPRARTGMALSRSLPVVVLLVSVAPLSGCGSSPVDDADASPTPTPTPTPAPYAGPVTNMQEYMTACESELGPFPAFNCYEGEELLIPVTDASGSKTSIATSPADLENGFRCDKPSRLSGCVPYSRVGTKVNERGSTFTFVCRLYYFRDPVGTTDDGQQKVMFEDLGVIGQNPNTGKTCYWAVPIDGTLFDGTVIPRPGSPEDESFFPDRGFWYTLDQIAGAGCRSCHDNDPYIHTPWVEQAGVVPNHPLTPYEAVAESWLNELGGVSDWSPARYLKKPEAAPCLQCHRLADRFTCGSLVQDATGHKTPIMPTTAYYTQTYPYNHWMNSFNPATLASLFPTEDDWDRQFAGAVDAIDACCRPDAPADCWE